MNFLKIFLATFLAIVVSVLLLFSIFIGGITGLILSATSSGETPANAVLVVDLREEIVDSFDSNPLSMVDFEKFTIKQNLTTLNAIRAIERAAEDDNIRGIYIRPSSGATASLSVLEELRTEIERFKQSGKFVVAYSDSYSQGGYYLSTVADSLYLQREGSVVWQGLASTPMFYKGLFDKLDVNVEVFRPTACLYKSAIEPLTRADMSRENREQSRALVASLWGSIIEDVAQSRSLTSLQLNRYASSLAGFIAEDAKMAGLVDGLVYEDQMEQILISKGVDADKYGKAQRVTLARYSNQQRLISSPLSSGNKVAVIYAEGVIVDGRGEVGEVGGDALARVISRARGRDDIKSVVLRVNSPGGSALASDVVWREMELLQAAKPVVVSMGSYAASGGYYISCPADVIVANRATITGSIGVYGVMMDIEESLSSKLGITSDVVKSNPSADFMRTSRPVTAAERVVMTKSVDKVYNTFVGHVATGRNLTSQRAYDIAQGRVYTGAEAATLGLVDAVGGVKSAILIAAERGGVVSDFQVEEISSSHLEYSTLMSYMNTLVSRGMQSLMLKSTSLKNLKVLESKGGVVMYSPVRVEWM